MKSMPCPKCGTVLDLTGRMPGSKITCACGNVVTVPSQGMSRKVILIIVGIAVVVLICPCVGILTAIAIPNFIRFQARSKQVECKVNLKAWYTAERVYLQEKDAYSPSPAKIDFSVERGNRYAYFSGPGPLEDRSSAQAVGSEETRGFGVDTARFPGKAITLQQLPARVAQALGVSGTCPKCDITLACAGQIDNDATLDVWTISTAARSQADGTPIPAGVPFNEVNDVTE